MKTIMIQRKRDELKTWQVNWEICQGELENMPTKDDWLFDERFRHSFSVKIISIWKHSIFQLIKIYLAREN